MAKNIQHLVEVLTSQDGNFNDEIGAYVSAYPISSNKIVVELEYTDTDNDDEVIETVSFTIDISGNED